MNFEQALKWVHSLSKFGSKPGLERVSRLASLLGNPQDSLNFIHIAGTSGKGSIAGMCASCLTQAGLKAGLYTSPYVVDFCERFQINGKMISKKDFSALCEKIIPLVEKMNSDGEIITEFEFITVLAFMYFKQEKCDIVCLEVGMGGRFDATNIISPPLVSVITYIGLDHTAFLGDTVEKIAFEKCGIIKSGSRCVCYPLQRPQALDVIQRTCNDRDCSLAVAPFNEISSVKSEFDHSEFYYGGVKYCVNMPGEHQVSNAITAVTAIKELAFAGITVTDEQLVRGISSAFFPARIEILSKKPLVIVDGAHNADKISALRSYISGLDGNIISICGMLRDKDYHTSSGMIASLCKSVITISPDNPRALSAQDMANVCSQFCSDCTAADSVSDAVSLALSKTKDNDILLCWGSLYISGELRREITKQLKK